MLQRESIYYHAYASRDPRFDGVFFIGVTSTGIYCRPICPAKTPKPANCHFFLSAEAAEKEGFRPCLRCRPELASGNAPIDDAHRIALLITHRLGEGLIEGETSLEEIAAQFDLSSRQIRRIIQQEFGVSPIELIQTRRLLLAKQLLTGTKLPITEVAFASGFSSLRRFNNAFRSRYGRCPTKLRKEATNSDKISDSSEISTLQLTYRPPYDWEGILKFLSMRTLKGAEWVTEDFYARTVSLGNHKGWIKVSHAPQKNALILEFTHNLTIVLPTLLGRIRNLFDLSAHPDLINAHLIQDKLLQQYIAANPGVRVPGAFDGFELAVRAILGQQITVKAATTLACRLTEAFSEKLETPFPELHYLSPTAENIALATVEDIAKLGIVNTRAKSIIALAQAVASGKLKLEAGTHPDKTIKQLISLPGIGPWTAHYIAMRTMRWPDAFPKEDIAIRNNLGGVTAKQAEAMSQAWRPWRSYAVFHIWQNLRKTNE